MTQKRLSKPTARSAPSFRSNPPPMSSPVKSALSMLTTQSHLSQAFTATLAAQLAMPTAPTDYAIVFPDGSYFTGALASAQRPTYDRSPDARNAFGYSWQRAHSKIAAFPSYFAGATVKPLT